MSIVLPENPPQSAAELWGQGQFDDQLYMTAKVQETGSGVQVTVDSDCSIITTVKGWDEESGGLQGVFSRADAIKNLNGDIHQLTGNAVVYIKMPGDRVLIWTTERDGPPQWAGYSTGVGGIVGPEGPAITSVKEMSEEVGIVIGNPKSGYRLLCPEGVEGCVARSEKSKQIETVRQKLDIDSATLIDVQSVLVKEYESPCHQNVQVWCNGEMKQQFRAHVLAEADHFDKPENIGNTVSFQRYFMIDLSGYDQGDIQFVNPDPFDSPVRAADYETLRALHVLCDGQIVKAFPPIVKAFPPIVKAFPPIASILHPDNRDWAHPRQMLNQ